MTEERAGSSNPSPHQSQRPSAAKAAIAWARDLTLSVVIAFVVIIFIYQPVKVEGTSMMPALVDQERIFVNKFIYRLGIGEIQRGDTIVFWFPFDQSKSYIKRVIGLPGDIVAIDHGTVILNGKPLQEDYVPREYRDYLSMPPQKVRPDEYFVLGDRRNSSNDSRTWGQVPRNCIYGKAVFVYWPLTRIGPLK
jgi:signal peptidase I